MEITIIGFFVIILSIIALYKNEDWLLYLTMFFSTFTAASAINIYPTTTAIVPFEIPALLWFFKQIFNIVKNGKEYRHTLFMRFKENKICKVLLAFIICILLSEIYFFISGIKYDFYDSLYKKNETITFGLKNITQSLRIIFFSLYSILVSLRIREKKKIKKILAIFLISSVLAIIWGLIQFSLFYLQIDYPAGLFNNNPWYAQGYDQVMHGIKRVNSIATEPSVFALNLLTILPFPIYYYTYGKEKYKWIYAIISIITIICICLTTSSTAIVGMVLNLALIIISLIKENLDLKCIRKKANNKMMCYIISAILLSLTCIYVFNQIYIKVFVENLELDNDASSIEIGNIVEDNTINNKDFKENDADSMLVNQHNNTEELKDYNSFNNVLLETTIKKLSSGSGQERMSREMTGMEIFKLSPFFGVGFGSFRTFNLVTNLLVNMGILGVSIYIYLIFVLIKNLIINRKKDLKFFYIFFFSILGILMANIASIPDLIYIYTWIIFVLSYNYFQCEDENDMEKKRNKDIIIGIDARGLNNKKTGIATYIEEVMKELTKNQEDNVKYILYSTKELNIDIKESDKVILKNLNKKIGTMYMFFKLPKILKEDNVDIFWGTQHLLPKRDKNSNKIKYVLTVHDLAIHKLKTVGELKNTIIQKIFLKHSCKNADIIMADSKATKQDIIDIFKIDKDKIHVVYLGTNLRKEYSLDEKQENQILNKFKVQDKNYLFFVSTIEPRKNVVTLIKAFEAYRDNKKNEEMKLILSGGLGWKYEDVLNAIDNSKYKEDINLTGYISKDEKECLLHNARCFVYPSLYEGFGLPILEAMSKGALVVTCNVSSMPEVGGKAAFYIDDVYDYNELYELIDKVVNLNIDEREERIKLGYGQVEKFKWDKCANDIINILLK